MTTSLFDHDMDHRPDPAARRTVRRLVLAGVLHAARDRNGWSVNDAASKASVAPMTWRRMEQGLDVRRRSLTAVDSVLGLPFGSTSRALEDDLAMIGLLAETGTVVDEVSPATAAEFLDTMAERARSGGAAPSVRAHAVTVTDPVTVHAAAPRVSSEAVVSDLTRAAQLVDAMVRHDTTPALKRAVEAVLAAMPDLVLGHAAETAAACALLDEAGLTATRAAARAVAAADRAMAGCTP